MATTDGGSTDAGGTIGAPPREVKVGGREVYDGKLLDLRVDTVRMPSGRETAREVVAHPGSVAIVALTRDGQVLLLRHFRYAVGRDLLELPAGTLDPGETPEATARRELLEETGYAPGRLTELASVYSSPGYTTERITIFRADECTKVEGATGPEEALTLAPTPLAAVPLLVAPGADQVHDAKTLLGLLFLLRQEGGLPGGGGG